MKVVLSPEYLAGVFDSDGSFSLSKRCRPDTPRGYGYGVTLQLTWKTTDKSRRVLEKVKQKYGGSLFESTSSGYSGRAKSLKYSVAMRKAIPLISDILPFLNLKRTQARICLEFAESRMAGKYNCHRPQTDEQWEELDYLYERMRELNTKNGKGHPGQNGRYGVIRDKKIFLVIGGERRSLDEWAKISGTPYYRILQRHRSGWSDKDAVFLPRYYRMRGKDGAK